MTLAIAHGADLVGALGLLLLAAGTGAAAVIGRSRTDG